MGRSVTGRIREINQPYGGFLKPTDMVIELYNDDKSLSPEENIHPALVGLAVDYLSRYLLGQKLEEAFFISLKGARIAEDFAKKNVQKIAFDLLYQIKGIDDNSIACTCKLAAFDVWYRSLMGALTSATYAEINPDSSTIANIRIMVERSLSFFEKNGPVVKCGFTFGPEKSKEEFSKNSDPKSKGGYTGTVSSGDGDILTAHTLWDFKVSKANPTKNDTLQLLMYWVMGKHSGQKVFDSITKIGIFNPRLHKSYIFDIDNVQKELIDYIEKVIMRY